MIAEATDFDAKLLEWYGVGNPSELTSYERYQAYEKLKREIKGDAKEYEQEIKRIAEYLDI